MTNDHLYRQQLDWQNDTHRQADRYLSSAVQYEDMPSDIERADWCYRGNGPYDGANVPQEKATDEETERMNQGWRRLVEKAKRDAMRIGEEHRLRQSVAMLQPTEEIMAAVIKMMRGRR